MRRWTGEEAGLLRTEPAPAARACKAPGGRSRNPRHGPPPSRSRASGSLGGSSQPRLLARSANRYPRAEALGVRNAASPTELRGNPRVRFRVNLPAAFEDLVEQPAGELGVPVNTILVWATAPRRPVASGIPLSPASAVLRLPPWPTAVPTGDQAGRETLARFPIARLLDASKGPIPDEKLDPLPHGFPGELHAAFNHSEGYLHGPELNIERLIADLRHNGGSVTPRVALQEGAVGPHGVLRPVGPRVSELRHPCRTGRAGSAL